ncbi:MAG: DUF1295 domain-containing protein [Candidatus Lokiarchaeota archaeon]|nr:DUF1295 domain-containing protein [Candidatus Lokiarchaeota archaeon]
MKKEDIRSIFVIIFVVVLGILLAIAGGDGGLMVFGNVSLFALNIGIAFIIQWLVFIPSYLKKTEKFYDLTGSVSYVTIIITTFLLSPTISLRSGILMVMVLAWSLRLGIFLFRRVIKAGKDRRFDDIKQSPFNYLKAWTIQGLWVSFTIAAALAAMTSGLNPKFGVFGILGIIVWIVGYSFEAIADFQKNKFRSDLANKGKFIHTGLWSLSRHPNYFGEITIWIGVVLIAFPSLQGLQYITLISPVFVALLITKVSGVPKLEKYADEKWGGQEDYEKYKRETPVLIPKLPLFKML